MLKSRIWSYPGGDKYSFVDDICPQYLHCTDEDQQSETARLSTVDRKKISKFANKVLEKRQRRRSVPNVKIRAIAV